MNHPTWLKRILFCACLTLLPGVALPAEIIVQLDKPGVIVPKTLHGLFFEDINYAADGGLYAELIQNRSFQHRQPLYAWREVTGMGTEGKLTVESDSPLNASNPNYLRINITQPGEHGYGAVNSGFDGIAVQRGDKYLFSIYARQPAGSDTMLRVVLKDGERDVAAATILGIGPDWKKHEAVLTSSITSTNGRLQLFSLKAGTVDVDMVSLFPEKTYKNRPNGLRADLAQALADVKPGFLRFPGGCIVEGRDFSTMYRWKETIGDVAERKQNWNLWSDRGSPQYHQTYGLGFFEYFQFCEDIGAEPLPVINCGMCCQARQGPVVPMAELGPYVQDALDLIEFANGPVTSTWGAKRAAMGHPKPFNMRYLAVGNEQWEQGYFDRYDVFYKALKAKNPEIKLISSAGPLPDDGLWRFAWNKFHSGTPADLVDEHYYVAPRWLLENGNRYDSYDRKGPKIFVGEYAGHDRGRRNNLRSALSEAAYMTSLLRNADVVELASYAPLFAKMGHIQWQPDLIWFDNSRAMLTPNYHVQALFAQNRPDSTLPTRVTDSAIDMPKASGMVGVGTWNTSAEYKDIKVTSADGKVLFESDFSKGLDGWKTSGGEWKVVDGALQQGAIAENCKIVAGNPAWSNYDLTLKARKLSGQEGFLVLFETPDANSPVWWNLGGWRNTQHGLQGEGLPERQTPGVIEANRWYDIRIESRAGSVKAYLDGKLVQQGERKPVATMYAIAGRAKGTGGADDLLLNVVNFSNEPQQAAIKLEGAGGPFRTATATVLTSGSADDENTLDQPAKVVPVKQAFAAAGPHVFPPNSLTVIRMQGGK